MKLKRETVKVNKVLKLLAIVSIIIELGYVLTRNMKEVFPGGDEIFNIFSNLSLAYISSFIFYILTVYIPEKRKKSIVDKYIKYHVKEILYIGQEIFFDVLIQSARMKVYDLQQFNIKFPNVRREGEINLCNFTKEDIKMICSYVKSDEVCSKSDKFGRGNNAKMLTIGEFLAIKIDEINFHISKIIINAIYLDEELLDIITTLEISDLITSAKVFKDLGESEKSLYFGIISQDIFKFYEILKNLQANTNIIEY